MRYGQIRGWGAAVERARELWPDIPEWAFLEAGNVEAPEATCYEAEWFSVHPTTAGDVAVRVAVALGWKRA